MGSVQIFMFGRFDIVVDGKSTFSYYGHSPKGILLLKYLLLNRTREIPTGELLDALYHNPEKGNPRGALKTLVSRLRACLAKAAQVLGGCIVTRARTYKWNEKIDCWMDIAEFEKLCAEVKKQHGSDAEMRERYRRILDLYKGDVGETLTEDWLVTRSAHLHHLYISVMHRFIDLLEEGDEHDLMVQVCYAVLEVDPYDEKVNTALIRHLNAQGHRSAALRQHRFMVDAYTQYLGVEPSESLLNIQNLPEDDRVQKDTVSMDELFDELRESEERAGAFVCGFDIFRAVCHFHRRNSERAKTPMFLALATVTPHSADKADLNTVMDALLEILVKNLRKGDIVTRYSPTRIALLLPATEAAAGNRVLSRVRERFSARYPLTRYMLSIRFVPAETD